MFALFLGQRYTDLCVVFRTALCTLMFALFLRQRYTDVCVVFRTALHWASKRNHSSVVQLLLANGADASLQTKKGETAVQLAREDTVILLLGGIV